MGLIRITKNFDFEAAHALYGYDGKCKNIHGHSYKLSVCVLGMPINDAFQVKNGMVMDFGDLKKIVNQEIVNVYDHATVLNRQSPHLALAETLEAHAHKIVLVDYQPTSENMLLDFAKCLKKVLPKNVTLHSLKLYETVNSFAEWFASDNS